MNKKYSYIVNAQQKTIGRLASEVALLLRGKRLPGYQPYKTPHVRVTIEHFSEMIISEKKLDSNYIYRFTGYPSGRKRVSWRTVFEKDPQKLFLHVLKNMLPNNSFRDQLLKKVLFT